MTAFIDVVPLRGLSIEEIARLLGRDHGDVRDKVVEIGRPAVDLLTPTGTR